MEQRELLMIRPRLLRPSVVITAVAIGGFCLIPVVLQPVSSGAVMGLGSLAAMCLLFSVMIRRVRLKITETEVRARQGGVRQQPDRKAFRSEIRSIHYLPNRISSRGADDQPLMEPVDIWAVQDMLKAAEALQVLLYDHRGGFLGSEELSAGRLVYDPNSGPVPGVRR